MRQLTPKNWPLASYITQRRPQSSSKTACSQVVGSRCHCGHAAHYSMRRSSTKLSVVIVLTIQYLGSYPFLGVPALYLWHARESQIWKKNVRIDTTNIVKRLKESASKTLLADHFWSPPKSRWQSRLTSRKSGRLQLLSLRTEAKNLKVKFISYLEHIGSQMVAQTTAKINMLYNILYPT